MDPRAVRTVAREDASLRMAESVAIAYLKYLLARRGGVEEPFSRRSAAAMVQDQQQVGAQSRGMGGDECPLLRRLDIAGQQGSHSGIGNV